ncbi:PREDICTED: SPRY domain-containing protein 7 [Nicrophorus vespilloides]|uniref:SPRY domain-containing protein 7 n=1 Tax=Nicrophorus vespilloides TaxID=110193 RepID=A0ABM1MGY8_NICVS|nr:PREDICTED: SPRY domain-containing protein 7 [Nicrophorus vespilloides]
MTSVSMFSCFRSCLDGLNVYRISSHAPHAAKENPIHLDTAFLGYEVVIVKSGHRLCGAGAALGNAPLVQSKSYFEVKIQQGGSWSIGLATRQTDLSLTQGGNDEYSWALCSDNVIRHNKQEIYRIGTATNIVANGTNATPLAPQEGDIISVSYDHIQLKFYLNGSELEFPVTNVKGTVYPALYVDDGAILDIILDNFNIAPPGGFDKIMLEQSLL